MSTARVLENQSNYIAMDILRSLDLDSVSYKHSLRVARTMYDVLGFLKLYGVDTDLLLGVKEEDVILGASLHDIGKVYVPKAYLNKNGRLTDEEFNTIKEHSSLGRQLLFSYKNKYNLSKDSFNVVSNMIYAHHENFNGSGYPEGLRGNQIPAYVKILTVLDVYDALLSVRPYKKAMTHKEACTIIYKDVGIKYDPNILKLLKVYFNR